VSKVRLCSVKRCKGVHLALGYCNTHYLRVRKHGRPDYVSPKCLPKGATKNPTGHSHSYVQAKCGTCGKPMKAQIRRLDRGGGKFCSPKCNPRTCKKYSAAEVNRRSNLRTKYGLTMEGFERILAAQDGACVLCGNVPSGRGSYSRLHVDHNHTTGQRRALLCARCNAALGLFKENVDVLRKAQKYLEFWELLQNADKLAVIKAVEGWGFRPANDNEADAIALLRLRLSERDSVEPVVPVSSSGRRLALRAKRADAGRPAAGGEDPGGDPRFR
jgi:hypothetical protein